MRAFHAAMVVSALAFPGFAAMAQQAPATTAPAPVAAPDDMKAATAPVLPIFKVFQFPADALPRIDGKDDDWAMVPDSYTITLDQMHDDQHIHALSLIHISEPTRQAEISYAVFCLKKKK